VKQFKKVVAILVASILCMSAFAGCSGDEAASGDETASSAGTAAQQTMSVNIETEPAQLNSVLVYDVPSMNILLSVQEGLTKLDSDLNVVPAVAESWDISDDQLTYTFHLRASEWSNGDSVTAEDFKYAWMEVLSPDSGSTQASLFYVISGAQDYNLGTGSADDVGISVIDDSTLQVVLAQPATYFLSLCAKANFLPVNEEFYESLGGSSAESTYGTDADKLVFNGPWVMSEWSHNSEIVLTKNDNYYDKDDIKLDEINFLMVSESSTAYNMFTTGELDVIDLDSSDMIELAEQSGYTTESFSMGSTTIMTFNTTNEIMSNANIRKAFSYAIDRENFVTNVLKNGSHAAYSMTSPVVTTSDGEVYQELVAADLPDVSVSEAKSYLEKGMEELGITELPTITFLIDDRDSIKTQAAVYQEYWKNNLGVDVEIESMPYKSKLAKETEKDFMISIYGWEASYNDPMSMLEIFMSDNANNVTSYSNSEYDGLLEQARTETDTDTHYELLKEAELILMDDAPIAPLYYSYQCYAAQPKVQGFIRSAAQDMIFNYAYISD